MTKHYVFGNEQKSRVLRQYGRLREEAGCMLLSVMGDFFEILGDDAAIAADVFDVHLNRRGDVPMCGIPADSRFSEGCTAGGFVLTSSTKYFAQLAEAGIPFAIAAVTGRTKSGMVERSIVATYKPERRPECDRLT